MPIFDTVMQEKPPVVLDIGSVYTKIGLAAEAFPRFIIPSEVQNFNFSGKTNIFVYKDEPDFYDHIVNFIQRIFFKYILVSPKDRKVVIVESILCPTIVRETLAKALFRHFEVSAVLFVPTHLVVLSTLAVSTALVVDIGYKEAVAVPVYSGVQVVHAWQAQPLGSESVHAEIRSQLIAAGVSSEALTDEVVEDIKVRTCFVTSFDRAQKYRDNSDSPPQPCPDVDYRLANSELIVITGKLRETAFEVLFPNDNDHLGLPNIILDAILKCPIDMRINLAENLILIGGTSMIMGLASRLKDELLSALKSDWYSERLFLKSIKFHTAPSKANFTAWLGGSIYGGTDLVLTKSLTREAYAKCSRVPDWICVEECRPPGNA